MYFTDSSIGNQRCMLGTRSAHRLARLPLIGHAERSAGRSKSVACRRGLETVLIPALSGCLGSTSDGDRAPIETTMSSRRQRRGRQSLDTFAAKEHRVSGLGGRKQTRLTLQCWGIPIISIVRRRLKSTVRTWQWQGSISRNIRGNCARSSTGAAKYDRPQVLLV